MSDARPPGPRLRKPLSSRQRQDLINQHERGWLNGLLSQNIAVGHHPFLSAGDAEIVEDRFFERLRAGAELDRNVTGEEFARLYSRLQEETEQLADRAVVVFSPTPGTLGAFVTDSRIILPRLETVALQAAFDLALMTLDAAHGLSIERNSYSEEGQPVEGGILLVRAWGDFATTIGGRL